MDSDGEELTGRECDTTISRANTSKGSGQSTTTSSFRYSATTSTQSAPSMHKKNSTLLAWHWACLLISDYIMAIGESRMLRNATNTSPLHMSVSTHCHSRSLFTTESTAGEVDKACLAHATMATSIRT
jgi:hypothetical protein